MFVRCCCCLKSIKLPAIRSGSLLLRCVESSNGLEQLIACISIQFGHVIGCRHGHLFGCHTKLGFLQGHVWIFEFLQFSLFLSSDHGVGVSEWQTDSRRHGPRHVVHGESLPRRQRTQLRKRYSSLKDRLKVMAPVNRANRLNRVPSMPARIIRALDEAGLLGVHLTVVGTNALFAYEVAAGVICGFGPLGYRLALDAAATF